MGKRTTNLRGNDRNKGGSVRDGNNSIDTSINPWWMSHGVIDPFLQDMIDAQNGEFDRDAIANGGAFSQTDLFKMQYELNKIQGDRDWQEYFYNQYQSLPAQVNQMRQAGLNPALMYGNGATLNSSPVGGMSSGGAPTGNPGALRNLDKIQGIISMITGMASVGTQLGNGISTIVRNKHQNTLSDSQANLADAQAETENEKKENIAVDTEIKRSESEIKKVEAEYARITKLLENQESRARIAGQFAQIRKIVSDMQVNDSVIRLNNAEIELKGALTDESEARAATEISKKALIELDIQKAEKLMPYVQEYQESLINLNNAQTDASKAAAEKASAEAAGKLLDNMVLDGMIKQGYIDEKMKGIKSERRRAVADCIVGNVCKVANTVIDGYATVVTGGLSHVATNIGNDYTVSY